MHLRLVNFAPSITDGFEIPERDLRQIPTRPGVSQEQLSFRIPAQLAAAAGDVARKEGLQEDAWIGLVIESERVVRLAAPLSAEAESLRAHLDQVAANPLSPVPGSPARASAFASALRELRSQEDADVKRIASPGQTEAKVCARVPAHAVVAWQRGAITARMSLGEWAAAHLGAMSRGRVLWEASAVEAGETLAEWVLVQDARRRSTR